MTRHNNILLFITSVLLLTACTSEEEGITTSPATFEEIKLCAVPHVEAEISRAIDYTAQNDVFDNTTKLGLFIIHENKWNNLSQMDDAYYGYNNIPVTIQADGSIKANNDTTFYYPADSDKKVAAAMYAPYDAVMTWDKMEAGYTFSVADNQSTEEAVLKSDLLVGHPVPNPFRKPNEVVPIKMKHALVKITLNIDIDINEGTMCDSMSIVIKNAPKTVKFHLKRTAPEAVDEINTGDIIMQTYKNPFEGEEMGTVKHITATAIVMPLASTKNISFEVSLIKRINGLKDMTLTAKQSQPRSFISGKALNFSLKVHASDTGYDETLPDEGDDDWVVGSKKY